MIRYYYLFSLGASHDGYSSNGCPADLMYLMAGSLPNSEYISPSLASNPFDFSSCTRQAVANYIIGLAM